MNEERLSELLVDRATEGLDPAAEIELREMLALGASFDPDAYELAAAAVHLTSAFPLQAMPAALEQAIRRQAEQFFGETKAAPRTRVLPFEPRPPAPSRHLLPWTIAAASLLFAVAGWWPESQPVERDRAPAVAAKPSLAEVLAAADVRVIPWSATADPAGQGAGGDVVWSTRLQAGFMRFENLAPNQPRDAQFQLWIFDRNQDERYPIDGGVFDVGPGAAVVPIDAKLVVAAPTLFAVTLEKPGGVVVSSRERLVLLAPFA